MGRANTIAFMISLYLLFPVPLSFTLKAASTHILHPGFYVVGEPVGLL